MSKTIQHGSLTHVPVPIPQPAGNGLAREGDFAQMLSPTVGADLPIGASHEQVSRDNVLIASPLPASGFVTPIFASSDETRVVSHLPKSQPAEKLLDERLTSARCPEVSAAEVESILLPAIVSLPQSSSQPYASVGTYWGAPASTSEQISFAECGPGGSCVPSLFVTGGASRSAFPVLPAAAQNGYLDEITRATAALDLPVPVPIPAGEIALDHPVALDLVPVWSRIYPEHWLANGYLSVVDVSVREFTAGTQTPAAAPVQGGIEGVASGAHPCREAAADNATQAAVDASSTWAVIHHLQKNGEPESSDSIAESDSGSSGLALADHVWAEQLLRVSRDRDGVSTVWLRDYALATNAIDPLIETLRRHALREGWVLGRIVVNGHEVWRAVLGGRKSDAS